MRHVAIVLLFIFAAGEVSLHNGCKRYEEGPALSFRTRIKRLTNTWQLEKYTVDDVDKTDEYFDINPEDMQWKFKESEEHKRAGTWEVTAEGYIADEGVWKFQDDDLEVLLVYPRGFEQKSIEFFIENESQDFEQDVIHIFRLTMHDFWFYIEKGDVRHEYYFTNANRSFLQVQKAK